MGLYAYLCGEAGLCFDAALWLNVIAAVSAVWGVLLGVTGTLALQARKARRKGKAG